jgi:hypothetical protein
MKKVQGRAGDAVNQLGKIANIGGGKPEIGSWH